MKKIVILLLLLYGVELSLAKPDRLVTLSSTKARSLAMGGAFVTIKDNLSALDFNPAGFTLDHTSEEAKFCAFFNLLGPVLILKNNGNYSNWTVPLGWIVRGLGFSKGRIQVGVLFGEEVLSETQRLERYRFFDAYNYEGQRNTSIGFSLKLADRVSLGIAGEFFIRNNPEKSLNLGYRYGIIMKPKNNLTVGLCYVNFPNDYKNDRLILEGLSDETLNIGISYSPSSILTFALDVRNVSDEGKGAVREPHLGLEVIPFRNIALRSGYIYTTGEAQHIYSLGLGFFKHNNDYQTFPFSFELNTAYIWQKMESQIERWFLLSFILRI
jgi:hypothetical protein